MAVAEFLKREAGFRGAVFAAGFLLSWLPLVLADPTLPAVDELFQYLEAGHRLVFGYGMVAWEFDYGARSWALGYGAALPMVIAKILGAGPGVYLPLTWAVFSLPAAAAALCAGLWGAQRFGRAGGWIAALVAASWIDNLYFGGRVLSEAVGAHLLIIATYLAEPGYRVESRGRLLLAGFLAALAVVLRLQLAPAALLLWLWRWRAHRRLAVIAAGALAALLLDGAFDAATTGYPFRPLWENIRFNLLLDGANAFSVSPWWYYFDEFWKRWGLSLLPFMALALLGGRRQPLLLAMAAAILAVHVIIPHKEYRFVLPAVMLAAILCGLGLAEAIALLTGTLRRRFSPKAALAAAALAALGWTGLAAANAVAMTSDEAWAENSHMLQMVTSIGKRSDICGVGFGNLIPYGTGGYTFLHRPIPVYHSQALDQDAFIRRRPAYNALLIRQGDREFFESLGAFGDYALDHCNDEDCLFIRPGTCVATPVPRPPIGALSPERALDRRYPYVAGIWH